MSDDLSRRTYLSTGVLLLSGCTTGLPFSNNTPSTYPDISLVNQSNRTIQYQIVLKQMSDGQVILADGGPLGSEIEKPNATPQERKSVTYPNPITETGEYQLSIETSNDLHVEFDWDDVTEPSKQRGDTDGLAVYLYRDRYQIEWSSTEVG